MPLLRRSGRRAWFGLLGIGVPVACQVARATGDWVEVAPQPSLNTQASRGLNDGGYVEGHFVRLARAKA